MKKLTRSRNDRMVAGVIGGLGEYFNVDANLIRVLWVIITVFTGFIPGIVAYLLLWLILPQE
ncbi:PspC domain-containing protein [Methanoculleus taiwanensis]|uniref:PspC domain-containing protein n=1 Tax=Methanoculleus taiwanensis TaxID=1550565 RepID=UPI000FFF03CD|nr:PspC domain-containing protein [Methanoculleus taiwanensis]